MKAKSAHEVRMFRDIPNIGPAMERDFMRMGLKTPGELINTDPYTLYKKICIMSGDRKDPCVLDTFIAAVDFMNGAPARPWYFYTKKRKEDYPNI